MKLNIAINALAASSSIFPASASASGVVAKNARDDRAEEGSIRAAASKNQGAECSFAVGIEVQNSPDVGVLSCKVGETCVEDSVSSIGGRCVVSPDEFALDDFDPVAYAKGVAEQYKCDACDDSGTKFVCCGFQACDRDTFADFAPCGSCIGKKACYGASWYTMSEMGEDSCIGSEACRWANGELRQVESPHSNITFPRNSTILPPPPLHIHCTVPVGNGSW
eukprot:scaffold1547_cov57-Cyclotella_meneghiniana.AAC.6